MNPLLAVIIIGMEITRYIAPTRFASTACRGLLCVLGSVATVCLWLGAASAQADKKAVSFGSIQASQKVSAAKPRLDLRRPLYLRSAGDLRSAVDLTSAEDPSLGMTYANPYGRIHPDQGSSAEGQTPSERAATHFRVNSSHLGRHQVDQGTRMTGWKLRDDVFFGKSKGDLSGVALIWQRSQTDQVSLSGSGLRLTRRIN